MRQPQASTSGPVAQRQNHQLHGRRNLARASVSDCLLLLEAAADSGKHGARPRARHWTGLHMHLGRSPHRRRPYSARRDRLLRFNTPCSICKAVAVLSAPATVAALSTSNMMSTSAGSLRLLLSPSRQLLPSIARKAEGSSFAAAGRKGRLSMDSIVGIAVALLICISLFFATSTGQGNSQNEVAATANAPTAIGMRAWRDPRMQKMQQQLLQKDDQVAALELALRQQASTLSKVHHNIQTQETVIAALQQRVEAERTEKLRAIYSLGVMSQSLDGCQRISDRSEQQLEQCQQQHRASSHATHPL